VKVAVFGAGGYAGGELLRLLHRHPEVSDCLAVSRSQAGRVIADVHPALAALEDARFSDAAPRDAARGRDVVFLALEHGESSRVAEELFAADPGLVVDLAADFRVQDATLHERHYGPHAAPGLRTRFLYGLADVCGESLRGARAIAVPGCFATAAALALYPLARAPLEGTPSVFAITGSSGAGTQPRPTTHHPARAHNVFSYSGLTHRHNAEVQEQWRRWTGRPEFPRVLVHAGPFVRGIYLTLHARLATATREAPLDWYRSAYDGRPFVRVQAQPPELTFAVGTNDALLHAALGEDGREVLVTAAIDNLLKGAAGQAVQAMNLARGLPETAGLRLMGLYPC
jgi:N-acetyl-gamma-glutamyl-phosphate/LysW-gamma-L-alpha-aminoadipyl-6-phosphate reductase